MAYQWIKLWPDKLWKSSNFDRLTFGGKGLYLMMLSYACTEGPYKGQLKHAHGEPMSLKYLSSKFKIKLSTLTNLVSTLTKYGMVEVVDETYLIRNYAMSTGRARPLHGLSSGSPRAQDNGQGVDSQPPRGTNRPISSSNLVATDRDIDIDKEPDREEEEDKKDSSGFLKNFYDGFWKDHNYRERFDATAEISLEKSLHALIPSTKKNIKRKENMLKWIKGMDYKMAMRYFHYNQNMQGFVKQLIDAKKDKKIKNPIGWAISNLT